MPNAFINTDQRRRPAFTLVEILVVVVILGILAAIVVPQFASAGEDARQTAFASSVRGFRDATAAYIARSGQWPPDTSSGQCPAELEDYIKCERFERPTPVGGVWDFENNDNGVALAVGVHFNGTGETRDDDYMTGVDEIFDDGDLSTGSFQKIANQRYYLIIR